MRRRVALALVLGVLAAIAIVGAVLISDALARADALAAHRAAATVLRGALVEAEAPLAEAGEVLALSPNALVPAPELEVLADRHEAADTMIAAAEEALTVDADALDTEEVHEDADELRTLAAALSAESGELPAALDGLLATVATTAPTVESENFDGNNTPRIAFRAAADALDDPDEEEIGEALLAYLDAARVLEASHAAELTEKAGPLFDARMAVQAFARDLSGGVLLEFDWAPTVNGYGLGGSYGGTSYWSAADGGQATMTLSDSVAAQWPGAGVQALVVHEVGHAVLARDHCRTLFFDSDLYTGEEESWATAWAIGLGHTADGNGESIYGRPSDALIALSHGCR